MGNLNEFEKALNDLVRDNEISRFKGRFESMTPEEKQKEIEKLTKIVTCLGVEFTKIAKAFTPQLNNMVNVLNDEFKKYAPVFEYVMQLGFNHHKELLSIAEYIIENYPESTMAECKEHLHEYDTKYLLEILDDFFTDEILGINHNGSYEEDVCKIAVRHVLNLQHDRYICGNIDWEPSYIEHLEDAFGCKKSTENNLLVFMYYMLYDKGLIIYRTSVEDARLTELGEMCRFVYNMLYLNEDMVNWCK